MSPDDLKRLTDDYRALVYGIDISKNIADFRKVIARKLFKAEYHRLTGLDLETVDQTYLKRPASRDK